MTLLQINAVDSQQEYWGVRKGVHYLANIAGPGLVRGTDGHSVELPCVEQMGNSRRGGGERVNVILIIGKTAEKLLSVKFDGFVNSGIHFVNGA